MVHEIRFELTKRISVIFRENPRARALCHPERKSRDLRALTVRFPSAVRFFGAHHIHAHRIHLFRISLTANWGKNQKRGFDFFE